MNGIGFVIETAHFHLVIQVQVFYGIARYITQQGITGNDNGLAQHLQRVPRSHRTDNVITGIDRFKCAAADIAIDIIRDFIQRHHAHADMPQVQFGSGFVIDKNPGIFINHKLPVIIERNTGKTGNHGYAGTARAGTRCMRNITAAATTTRQQQCEVNYPGLIHPGSGHRLLRPQPCRNTPRNSCVDLYPVYLLMLPVMPVRADLFFEST